MDDQSILTLSVLVLLTALWYVGVKKKKKLPPGPVGLPILGYYPFLGKKPEKTMDELGKKYGPIFGLYIGSQYLVMLNNWDAMVEAYKQHSTLYRPDAMFRDVPFHFGIAGANGREWQSVRGMMMKAIKDIGMHRPRWEELIREEAGEIVRHLVSHGGKPFEMKQYLEKHFVNSILTLALGNRLPEDHPLLKVVTSGIDRIPECSPVMGLENFSPGLLKLFQMLSIEETFDLQKELQTLVKFVVSVTEEETKNFPKDAGDSFIEVFQKELQNHRGIGMDEEHIGNTVKGNVLLLLTGGSETSRSSMIYLLLAVAEHPEKQKKVQEELDKVIGPDGILYWADRGKVPYTHATLLESMRWKTLLPLSTLRMANKDIRVQGYDIPKGTLVTFNTHMIHNDRNHWNEPEKFLPERFLSEDGKKVISEAKSFAPFSYGKRNCPGKLVAYLEIFQYFVLFMQKCTVLPADGNNVHYKRTSGLTYTPYDVHLRFIPRQ